MNIRLIDENTTAQPGKTRRISSVSTVHVPTAVGISYDKLLAICMMSPKTGGIGRTDSFFTGELMGPCQLGMGVAWPNSALGMATLDVIHAAFGVRPARTGRLYTIDTAN